LQAVHKTVGIEGREREIEREREFEREQNISASNAQPV